MSAAKVRTCLSGFLVWFIFIFVCLLANIFMVWVPHHNNVCETLFDYMSINNNENCWYNPDVNSFMEEIVTRYDYNYEKHYVGSEDGYVIELHRILSKNNYSSTNQPILLNPGMGGAPETWLMQGSKSVAFELADNGYDVWLSALRGTVDIEKGERFSKSEAIYWDFSFHEMGIYDIPALTEYIKSLTNNNKKVIFIGHSMGTMVSYIYAIERKDHAEKHLKGILSLAPAAYLKTVKGFFQFIAPKNVWIYPLSKMLGYHALGQSQLSRKLVSLFCGQFPGVYGCYYFNIYASGISPSEESVDFVPMFFRYMPTTISMKTLAHFGQMIHVGRFQKFDYKDDEINLKKYNSTLVPEYDADKINVPVHLFVGKYDYSSLEADVDILYQILKRNGVSTSKQVFGYAHCDFFWGKNIGGFRAALLQTLKNLTALDS